MPAPTNIGNADASGTYPDAALGPVAETGINIEDFSADLEPSEVWLLDVYGAKTGGFRNHAAELSYTISGEVGDKDAGLNISTCISAITLSNQDIFASTTSTHGGIDFATSETVLLSASYNAPRANPRAVTYNYLRPLGFDVVT